MINFDNSVTNIAATPGIITATTAETPVASQLAPGTIFINSTTGVISQSNGTSFSTIGGGGGSTPGIDSVLAVNQVFTTDRKIDVRSFDFNIVAQATEISKFSQNTQRIGKEANRIYLLDNGGGDYIISTVMNTSSGSVNMGLDIRKPNNSVGTTTKIGDFANWYNGTKIIVDDPNSVIKTTNKSDQNDGIYLDQANNNYYIGTEQDFFQFDSANQEYQSFFGGNKGGLKVYGGASVSLGDFNAVYGGYCNLQVINSSSSQINTYDADSNFILGLKLDFTNSIFCLGDKDQHFNGNYIEINDGAASNITINGINNITFITDQIICNGPLTTTNNGTAVNEHLLVTINGVNYQIQLRLA